MLVSWGSYLGLCAGQVRKLLGISVLSEVWGQNFASVLVMFGVPLVLFAGHRNICLRTLFWSGCRFDRVLCAVQVGNLSDFFLVQLGVFWSPCAGHVVLN